jgi:hypothetical protein
MAGNISNYLETRLLDHSINKAAFTAPTAVGLALYTTTPNVDTGASGTEVSTSGTAYARVNILTGNAGGHFFGSAASADPSTLANAADIVFPTATAAWGTIVGMALLDSVTVGAGNALWIGALTASKVVNNGDVFKFLAGQLVLTLD